MKKKPDQDALVSELRGASAFFPQRQTAGGTEAAVAPRPLETPEPDPTPTEALADELERPSVRPSVRTPIRRTVRRHPFEFYQDQLETLKRFSLEEQLDGGPGSMSAMVREAIDLYIGKRTKQGRTTVRSDARTGDN